MICTSLKGHSAFMLIAILIRRGIVLINSPLLGMEFFWVLIQFLVQNRILSLDQHKGKIPSLSLVAMVVSKLYWIWMLLKNLRIHLLSPLIVWCDNQSAIALTANPIYHACTKHIKVNFHFICEKVVNKDFQIHYISTLDQVANIFTKSLTSSRFQSPPPFSLLAVSSLKSSWICNEPWSFPTTCLKRSYLILQMRPTL